MAEEEVIAEFEIDSGELPRNFLWQEDSHTIRFGMPGNDNNSTLYTITIE